MSYSYSLTSSGYGSTSVAPLPPKPNTTFVERKLGDQPDIDRAINWVQTNILDMFPVDCWVAGGSVRSILENISSFDCTPAIFNAVNDFDVYFSSERDFEMAKATAVANNATLIRQTPFSEKYDINGVIVDLVSVPHESPMECIHSFDFTVCCAAIDSSKLVHHKDYFLHTATKRIALNEVNNPVAAIARLQKYAKKGFEADTDTILTIARDIAMLDPDSNNFNIQGLY